jgi:phosphoglycerate dehydrogenase-like enzyme
LASALARSEYLFLACPLTDVTRGLIDGDVIGFLPPGAAPVNLSRGGVVDTGTLVDALRSNDTQGAALNVTDSEPLPEDHPLWTFKNVLIMPHNAGHTSRHYERLADIAARNVELIENGTSPLENQVVPASST